MNAVRTWWSRLNGIKKAIITVCFFVMVGSGGTLVLYDYRDLPERVEAVETRQEQVEHQLDRLDEKLDRVLCILEGEDPLRCERLHNSK